MGLPSYSGLNLYEKYKKGMKNLITDVKGVKAAAAILNGFGKSIGFMQIEELGTIETPIVMTNTLSVETAATALTKYMLAQNEDIGVTTGTVNCVVTECNDGRLNDIRGLHVTEEDVFSALNSPSEDFEEWAVGSGTGMCCLGLKGALLYYRLNVITLHLEPLRDRKEDILPLISNFLGPKYSQITDSDKKLLCSYS